MSNHDGAEAENRRPDSELQPVQPDRDEPDCAVGYKKPPAHTRFKKGQSGNPKGRPPREKRLSQLFSRILNETILVTQNGRRRKLCKADVIYTRFVNRAVQGDPKGLLDVFRMLETLFSYNRPGSTLPPVPSGVVMLPYNGRDDLDILQPPELTRRLSQVLQDWELEQQQKKSPANDNDSADESARKLQTG